MSRLSTIAEPLSERTSLGEKDAEKGISGSGPPPKGRAFWLCFAAIMIATFLSAMDLTAIGTALPTIAHDLDGADNFVWVGSAYALASTAFMPLSGTLANVFGRRPVMLGSIALFTLGSALCGAAQSMHWMIAARTIQGMGGGAILNMTEILVSDLVPLVERGLYQGLIALVFALASGIGPPIGGALSERASWRWVFYLNLPLCGIAFFAVAIYLRVKTPPGTITEKLKKVDWFGNFLIVGGTSSAIIGLTWAGTRYAWTSVQVLLPLILGLVIIGLGLIYDNYIPTNPTVPFIVLNNRVSLAGFVATGVHGITSITLIYYVSVYFQGAMEASPLRAGVQSLPLSLVISSFALFAGVSAQVFKRYIPANLVGWILTIVGFGLMSLLKSDSNTGQWVGYQIVAAAGAGVIYTAPVFPILAPLPIEHSAAALAFFGFIRSFAQTWGITIGSTILQNELKRTLPKELLDQFPNGVEIAYALIPTVPKLPEPLRAEIKQAFADSMSLVWKVMIGIAGAGLLAVLAMKEIEMHNVSDANYALETIEERREKKLPGGSGTATPTESFLH